LQVEASLYAAKAPLTFIYHGDAEEWLRRSDFTYNAVSSAMGRMLYRNHDDRWAEIANTPDHRAWYVKAIPEEEDVLNRLVPTNPLRQHSAPDRRSPSFVSNGQFN